MKWVLDASAALGLLLGDGDEALATAVAARLEQGSALVPQHWTLEVNSGLLVAARRGRLDHLATYRARQLLLELPVEIDAETADRCWAGTFELALRFGLTVYDAAYLELALRSESLLATADQALEAAAHKADVRLITDNHALPG